VFSEANPETFSDDNLSQKAFVDNASNLSVAVRVAFESKLWSQDITFQVQGLKPGAFKLWVNWKQTLKPVFHFIIGSMVETRRFQAMGHNWIQHLYSPTVIGHVSTTGEGIFCSACIIDCISASIASELGIAGPSSASAAAAAAEEEVVVVFVTPALSPAV
jgi:hypothetical protein